MPFASLGAHHPVDRGDRVEVAPNVHLDIGQLVATEIRDVVRTVSTEVVSAICEEIKAAIKAAWMPRRYRVAASGNQQALRLHIEPLGLGFSGLGLTRDGAVLQLTVTARTALSSGNRSAPRPRPTPALQDSPLGPTALNLISPLEIDYQHLERSLAERLVDQPLPIAIPAMTGTVTPRAVRIYPSNGAIVVGSLVDIDLPGFWPDVSGRVYLTAEPASDSGELRLRLDHLAFAPPADSGLWRELSLALDITLRRRLEQAAAFDLSGPAQQIVDAVTTGLSTAEAGATVQLLSPRIETARFIPAEHALVAELLLTAGAEMALTID